MHSVYIKCLKALCLNEASELLSLMLLSKVLYSTAPLYRSDRLLTHKSLLSTYNWLDCLDRVYSYYMLANMSDYKKTSSADTKIEISHPYLVMTSLPYG